MRMIALFPGYTKWLSTIMPTTASRADRIVLVGRRVRGWLNVVPRAGPNGGRKVGSGLAECVE